MIVDPEVNPTRGTTAIPIVFNTTAKVATVATSTAPPVVRTDFQCSATLMNVFIPVFLVPNSVLTLKDPSCLLHNNGSHHVISVAYDKCGTSSSYDAINNTVIRNEIRVQSNLNINTSIVEFVQDYTIPLKCTPIRYIGSSVQVVERDLFSQRDRPTHSFELRRYTGKSYTYPLQNFLGTIQQNREMYFEILLTDPSRSFQWVTAERCEAKPTIDSNQTTSFSLLINGCPTSPAVKVLPRPQRNRFRFSVQAFRFTTSTNQDNMVYIQCLVGICDSNVCQDDCTGGTRRRRRSAKMRGSVVKLVYGTRVIADNDA